MSEEKKETLSVKSPYIRPATVSLAVDISLCAGSSFGGGHNPADPGGNIDEQGQNSGFNSAGNAEYGGEWEEENP